MVTDSLLHDASLIQRLLNERVAWCVLFIDMLLLREGKDPKGTQEEQGTKLGEGCHWRGCLVQDRCKIEQRGPFWHPENRCNKMHNNIENKGSRKGIVPVADN